MSRIIPYASFDITKYAVRVRLNTKYFDRAVPVYNVELSGVESFSNDPSSDGQLVNALVEFFKTKGKGKVFDIPTRSFEFDCIINGEKTICVATFIFRDFSIVVLEIQRVEAKNGSD